MPQTLVNLWSDPAFSFTNLSLSALERPYVPGQLGRLGIFQTEGVDTLTIAVEGLNGKLGLIEPSARGGPGETKSHEKAVVRHFEIPHYQRNDMVRPDEVQNVRAFGSTDRVQPLKDKIFSKIDRHLRDLDATLEHQRMGAAKGIVYSRDGRVLTNLFREFQITKPQKITFAFSDVDLKIRKVVFDMKLKIEKALDGKPYSGIHAMVGNDFWIELLTHPGAEKSYLNTQQAAELRGDPVKDKFDAFGVTWERYVTGNQATAKGGKDYIEADEARFIPLGVDGLFITRFAPADYNETVNTIGLPRYVKAMPLPNDKGTELEIQSNPVSLCTRPDVLLEGRLG